MQHISKPFIVDLLRIFDKNRWIQPRIRYASVRSKPALINDLKQHFRAKYDKKNKRIQLIPTHPLRSDVPKIEFDLGRRQYLLDEKFVDIPRESRRKPSFSISRVPVTLDFSEFAPKSPGLSNPPAK